MDNYSSLCEEIRIPVRDWIDSIEDPSLRDLVRDNAIVAGGAIASVIQDDKPKDYDIYFRTKGCLKEVVKYYAYRNKYIIPDYIVESAQKGEPFFWSRRREKGQKLSPYTVICYSSNAITLTGRIQIVTCSYGDPEEVSGNFDYLHSQGVYDYRDDRIIVTDEIVDAMKRKRLVYTGSAYPLASLIRMRKFIRRGYSINAGQILKIALDINKLDLTNLDTLKRQLVGVDALYFMNLFRKINDEGYQWNLDSDALVRIIDEFYDNPDNNDDEDQDE